VAENLYVVDGLNVSNFSQGLGSTFVPMAFIEEVQVKMGGIEAEYGRTTGGVVNMVTKSGTNTLQGTVDLLWNPESLQSQSPDTYQRNHSEESREMLEAIASLGGPLVRDRLFFYAYLRYLETDRTDLLWNTGYRFEESDPYWGAKLQWSLSARHRLEGTYLSDQVEVAKTRYAYDPSDASLTDPMPGTKFRGGGNAILRYNGVLSDDFMLTAQAGRNDFERYDRSAADACPVAWDARIIPGVSLPLGCWVNGQIGTWSDGREAFRADADWFLGRHALRAGADWELNQSDVTIGYSGDAWFFYDYSGNWPFWPFLPPETEVVGFQYLDVDGVHDIESRAAYLQDSWSIAPNLTLSMGLRWESYEHRNAVGETFLEVDDQLAPRLGVVWDVGGDGRSKLYGSAGLYHLPYPTIASVNYASSVIDFMDVYILEGGVNPDGSPEGLGPQIMHWVWDDGEVRSAQETTSNTLDPISQSEVVVGYEQTMGGPWRLGIRGTARRIHDMIEDVSLDRALWEVYGVDCYSPDQLSCAPEWRIVNPGSDFDGWYDLDGDGELDPIFLTAEQMGYPDPERTYYSLELTARRRFSDNWMLQASYLWAHSFGNYEGLVNSDFGSTWAGNTGSFDYPGMMEYSSGDLPNDRRHSVKLFGAYAWRSGFQVGGNVYFRTGRPINSFGAHPTDPWVRNARYFSFFTGGEPSPRGSVGRTDSVWSLDLTLKYEKSLGNARLSLRADVFNVFDGEAVIEVNESAEFYSGAANPIFLEPAFHQMPRTVRFGIGVSF
jgi:hypothetical protein